jgi:hypothetical protein
LNFRHFNGYVVVKYFVCGAMIMLTTIINRFGKSKPLPYEQKIKNWVNRCNAFSRELILSIPSERARSLFQKYAKLGINIFGQILSARNL